MGAVVAQFKEHASDAESGDSGGAGELAVAGSGGHGGYEWYAGVGFMQSLLHGLDYFGEQRGRRDGNGGDGFAVGAELGDQGDGYFWIGGHALEGFAHVFGIFTGENPAIHIGPRGLRQGVGSMSTGKHGSHASGAQQRVVIRLSR